VLLLLILINAITLTGILLLASLYYNISKRVRTLIFSFKGLLSIIFVGVLSLLFVAWKIVGSVDLVKVFRADEDSAVLSMDNIASHFNFLPTHPFAMQIVQWQNGNTNQALFYFAIMIIVALVSITVWWRISYLFYPMWQKFQEGQQHAKGGLLSFGKVAAAYTFTGGRTLALFKKEALISSRNFKGVLWFSFLLFIWLMQIGANIILGNTIEKHQPDVSQKIAILQALQFIIAVYFISSFALRFVFPSFSVERKTAWILSSAPLSFKKIFFGKYFFYVTFFVLVGMLMSYLNTLVLGISFLPALYSMVLLYYYACTIYGSIIPK
jgi:hypothetical protein